MSSFLTRLKHHASRNLLLASAATSLVLPTHADPDYNLIGKNVAMVLQNGHFSRTKFSNESHQKFLDCYIKRLDPTKVYFTQKDIDELNAKYGQTFGDYLLAGDTQTLAEEIHALYNTRALSRIDRTLEEIRALKGEIPSFDSDRSMPRTRRDLAWAKDEAELDQIWKDQITELYLSEVLRRENIVKLAKEQGKDVPTTSKMPIGEQLISRFTRLRNIIQEDDLQDVVSELLSAVAHVYDPHSDYMGAREEQRFMDMMRLALIGIGAQLRSEDDGTTKIAGIVKGGPVQKSGLLQLGDRIVAVDRNSTGEWTDILYMGIEKVVDLVRGDKGKTVSLRVIKEDTGLEKVISIVREEVPLSDELASAKILVVDGMDVENNARQYKLGILTLPSFYMDLDKRDGHCASDIKQLLRRMDKEGVEGLVFDLRGNGGGSLEEVRKIVGLFTGSGPIVQVKNARGDIQRLTVSGSPVYNGELIVLCNKTSASASEIFAGAMADYGRAVIVGDKTTFGKGTVQVPQSLASFLPYFADKTGCGMLKFTTQKFYRVGGSSTQLKGVPSDVVIPSSTAAFEIGESELDNPLPYDEIAQAPGYIKDEGIGKLIPKLQELSAKRVAQDKDMQYLSETIAEVKQRIEQNSISLNKEIRAAEDLKRLNRKKEIDSERKVRYAEMSKEDAAKMKIYRLSLDDVDKEELPIAQKEEDDDYMEMEKDAEAELIRSPDYPSDLDTEMREALRIVRDLIDLHY